MSIAKYPGLLFLVLGFALPLPAQSPAPAWIEADFGPAMLVDWVQPQYPPAAAKAKLEGKVVVEFVVEIDGTVSREKAVESSDEVFEASALAAVRQWRFRPALEEAKPAISAMRVPVYFRTEQLGRKAPMMAPQAEWPVPLKQERARLRDNVIPEYPAELEERRLPGQVIVQVTVESDGRAGQPKVIFASHPAFVEVALRTLERAEFEPARQGPLVKASTLDYPIEFSSMGARTADILAANHLELLSEVRKDPLPVMLIAPVYPRDRLLAGESGTVVVEFAVDTEGQTTEVKVTTAAGSEFDAAMVAAIESWAFNPAQNDLGKVAVRLRATHTFAPGTEGPEARLAQLLQPSAEGVGGASGLDRKLVPLWRGFPVYPKALVEQGLAGDATVEFVIDRDGRVRLPQIVKSSADAFGWAAATAVSQWVFERPTRGGQAVDVTVRVPVAFKAPKR